MSRTEKISKIQFISIVPSRRRTRRESAKKKSKRRIALLLDFEGKSFQSGAAKRNGSSLGTGILEDNSFCFRYESCQRKRSIPPVMSRKSKCHASLGEGGEKKKAQDGGDMEREGGMEVELRRVQTIYHGWGGVRRGGCCELCRY
ncbi:hypothetical protein CEXT_5381 [Caerostris extrusa]|uniref:Uncharacterized protein n=1 Tax=Caerostris extrusa TaxID=172846 RepID=A0AAV4S4J7_CAEEX|nr:hypothetical protein CEXT_5381 [Caerostris extrusa]